MTFRSLLSTLPALLVIVFAALYAQAPAAPKFAGTGNQVNVAVNARDGRAIEAPQSSLGVALRPDSRLFVVDPPEAVEGDGEHLPDEARPRYYVFDGESFRELK